MYAVVGAVGAVVAALVSALVPLLVSSTYRRRHHIPDVLGEWNCEWFVNGEPYSRDRFKIERWTRDNRFVGTGHDIKGAYHFSGEVDSSRYVCCTYRSARYPDDARTGTFLLNVSVDGKKMEGVWNGLTVEGNVRGGRVVCVRQ